MRRGYTLIEVLIIVVILAVLATIAIPGLGNIIRRYELEEVNSMLEATRAGAKDYDFKIGLANLNVNPPRTQDEIWADLNIERPSDPVCTYNITAGGSTGRRLEVVSSSTWLYRYDLPNGPGAINNSHNDKKYIQNLPH